MEEFAKKLAINHHVEAQSDRSTFPLYQLKKDYQIIAKAYRILGESVAKQVPISPSGEWLLDNFYIIEEQYHSCMEGLSSRQYQKLPSVFQKARVLVLAEELTDFADGSINEEVIQKFLRGYQSKRSLSMEEIAVFPWMLKIALLKYIRVVSNRIVIEQLEKFKAESLLERIVTQKTIEKQQFQKYQKIDLNGEMMTFVEHLMYSLHKLGKEEFALVLEEELVKKGTTSAEIIKTLHFDMAVRRVSMSNSIMSLKNMARYHWPVLLEKINPVECLLKQDTIYARMEYQTKQNYLAEIQKIARKAGVSQVYVSQVLIGLGQKENQHIGFFLFGKERKMLAKALDMPHLYRKKPKESMLLGGLLLAIYLPSFFVSFLMFSQYFWMGVLPVSEVFVMLANQILPRIKKTKTLPQMEEISPQVETLVILPTLLCEEEKVDQMAKKMEVYYLANQDVNLKFCLLGDASESETEEAPFDESIKEAGIQAVRRLNEKYQKEIFYFIYRKRVFNASQGTYLGYERKRGMIEELNHYLLTGESKTFWVNTMQEIPKIKYVITLDADTNLILGTAKKLVRNHGTSSQ